MDIRETIIRLFHQVLAETGVSLKGELNDDTVLLESGLDSLGFAILVSQLDDELGYDPFSESEDAYYPQTLGAFISFYEEKQPK